MLGCSHAYQQTSNGSSPALFISQVRKRSTTRLRGKAPGPPEIVLIRLIEEGDVVVAEGAVRNAMADGGTLSLAFCDVFLMRDGLIRQLTSYLMPVP